MRVLIVNKLAWAAGGAERYSIDLARGLRARGHEVRLLSTADPRNEEGGGVVVPASVSHDTRDDPWPAAAGVALRAVWNRSAAAATERLVRDFEPGVMHVQKLYPQLSVAPVRVAARHGLPVVQSLHDYELLSASPLDDTGGRLDRHEARVRHRGAEHGAASAAGETAHAGGGGVRGALTSRGAGLRAGRRGDPAVRPAHAGRPARLPGQARRGVCRGAWRPRRGSKRCFGSGPAWR